MKVAKEFYAKFISACDLSNILTAKLKLMVWLKTQLKVKDVEKSALNIWHDGMFDVMLNLSNVLLNDVGKRLSSSKKTLTSFCYELT